MWKNNQLVTNGQITNSAPTSDLSYNWNIPYTNDFGGKDYEIKIIDLNNVADDISSNLFEIVIPVHKLVRQKLYTHSLSKYSDYLKINQGQPTTIEWDYDGNIKLVKIELWHNNLIETIVSSTDATTKEYTGWIPIENNAARTAENSKYANRTWKKSLLRCLILIMVCFTAGIITTHIK